MVRGLAILCVALTLGIAPAQAADCSGSSAGGEGWIDSVVTCESNGDGNGSVTEGSSSSNASAPQYEEYRWEPACNIAVGPVHTCSMVCPQGEVPFRLMGLHDGTWFPLDVRCASDAPAAAPQVTPALVARAFQRIPLPALRAHTQPADKTLINFDTIFYVDAQPLRRTLTLLGQRVELEITPSTFRWVHGDGTTAVTQTPGAAYPAKDVTYRYQHAHVTVQHHVEIVWTARWSLNGGPMQDVPGTVTTVGPATPLRVAEATPALSGYGH